MALFLFLQKAAYVYKVAAPWLIGSFVPSLIVGLSQFPKTEKAADKLRRALDTLSLVSFADSPGTFKPVGAKSLSPGEFIPLDPRDAKTPPLPKLPLILVFVFVPLALSGCAAGLDGVRQSVASTEHVLDASAKAMESYDHDHQWAIEKRYENVPATAKQELADYRQKRDEIYRAFLAVHGTLAAGYPLLAAVEQGLKSKADLNQWLVLFFQQARNIQLALGSIGMEVAQ